MFNAMKLLALAGEVLADLTEEEADQEEDTFTETSD